MKGFTLIEVLAASLIITLGASAAFALVQSTQGLTANAASQLEASYLAQEGMEIVRNIRDSNFLKIHTGGGGNWQDGLTGCESACQADYTSNSLSAYQDAFLRYESGLYSYAAGADSPFKRKIILTPQGADTLEVAIEVSWQERGREHTLKAATQLYNWLAPAP